MRKLVLIIGIFGVLSVGMFISSCNEEDITCDCYHHFSGPGSEGMSLELHVVQTTDDAIDNCADLNKTTTDDNGLITDIGCVHQ